MEIIPSDLNTYGGEAKRLLEDLQSRNERMFLVTVLFLNTAKTKQELDNAVFQTAGIAQKYNCSLRRLDYMQEQGLMSSVPLGMNMIPIKRALTTTSTAIFVPFTTQELFMGGESLYYGLNALSNNMIMVDRKKLKNPNGLILGTPGCFTGETKLLLPDGSKVSFLELLEKKEEVLVNSFDFQKQELVKARGYDVRCTKEVTELVEVELENGETARCTPDHWFLTQSAGYVEACNLKVGAKFIPEHEVKAVRFLNLEEAVPVYDISVEGYAVKKSRRQVQYHKGRYKEEESVKNSLHFDSMQGITDDIKAEKAGKQERERKHLLNRFWQKQRYKKARQAAQQGERATTEAAKTAQTFLEKAKSIVTSFFKTHKGFFGIVIAVLLFVLMIGVGMSSCSAVFQGTVSIVVGTTYASDDEDIYAVEAAYSKLEAELNQQINSMEARHEGYEEYRYQVDEISHNPYHLISYFTALYGDFTYEQVAGEIEEIFQQQYHLTTEATKEVVTETKKVKVGESLGKVVTSGYCNCSICCGSWSGGPTASGVYPKANHTIAVDANNPFVPIGTKVVMNGVEYTVEDTGAFARYGVQFDVYYDNHAAASAHGHQTWEAFIADNDGKNEIEVTTTQEINRMDITLTNKGLDAVLRSRMDENEEKRYDIYNTTYGNRDYLFDKNTIPMGGGNGGFGYEIPPEALTDERFANMIREAEKYVGYPYVWGGASPSTSFDCSGFVSWVINNCGNGWNVGRQTADGLRSCCAYVPPEQAKPGDLIFFQGTYDTPGASHVGIYVGNQVMIHCGDPIQYANINTSYWQQHFMAFGRLP